MLYNQNINHINHKSMKLYVIGTAPQSNIQLRSQYGSSYHAELLLLDNGDMLLTDRGSKNGTYLNGHKITPDKDVNVKRGDEVIFADERLDWNQIPTSTVDMTKVKEIRSIGSHPMNRIHLHGDQVSRFHATIKKMADGKWYIQDHSKNGTTVNGSRIPKDQDVRLKKGDRIMCAGMQVANPVTGSSTPWGIIAGAVAAVACIAAAAYLFIGSSWEKTVVFISGNYHYEVFIGDDLVERISIDSRTEEPFTYSGTGFFISDDGKIVTNLHIAKPWEYDKYMINEIRNTLSRTLMFGTYTDLLTAQTLSELESAVDQAALLNNVSEKIRIVPVMDQLLVIPNKKIFAFDNAIQASVIAASENTDVDLALIQLVTQKLPEGADYVKLSSISKSADDVHVGDDIKTIGFPTGLYLQSSSAGANANQQIKLEAYETKGTCIRSGTEVNFEHNAMIEGGSSGSPVVKGNKVVGVISSGYQGTQYNFAIDARFIHGLIDKPINY